MAEGTEAHRCEELIPVTRRSISWNTDPAPPPPPSLRIMAIVSHPLLPFPLRLSCLLTAPCVGSECEGREMERCKILLAITLLLGRTSLSSEKVLITHMFLITLMFFSAQCFMYILLYKLTKYKKMPGPNCASTVSCKWIPHTVATV